MKNIVCNFDNKRQHKNCQNINTCELNPTPSRYKKQLEVKRIEALEKDELSMIEHPGDKVVCDHDNCIIHGIDYKCIHGVPHEWTGSCKMQCPRYLEARCIPVGGI